MLPKELEVKVTDKEVSVKNPLASKTVIANTLVLILTFISVVSPESLNVDPKILLIASGFINIALRFVTSERIGFGTYDEDEEVEIKIVNPNE